MSKHKDLENKVSAVNVMVGEESNNSKEREERLGTLEVKCMETTEAIDKYDAGFKEHGERLGTLEAKVIGIEEKLAPEVNPGQVNNSTTSTPETRTAESIYEEMNERRRKENNIVVYGAVMLVIG